MHVGNIYRIKALEGALLLSGPRRVGKTTILYQLAREALESGLAPAGTVPDPKSILYLSLDHPLLKLLGLGGALRLYHESIWPEGRPALLLLDEVQYSRNWGTEIKLLVDLHPEYRIAATGSASVAHRDQLAESGVGRWLTIPVPTLSFYEFVHIRREVEGISRGQPAPRRPLHEQRRRNAWRSRRESVLCSRASIATSSSAASPKRPGNPTSPFANASCARTS